MIYIDKIRERVHEHLNIVYKETTISTNDDVKEYVMKKNEGVVYIASEQLKGRGRIGHDFSSPKGGIYLSLYIDAKNIKKDQLSIITPLCAVAIYRAIKDTLFKETQIKWINDLLYEGKKVCGILAEAMVDKDNNINGIILGIGIDYKVDVKKMDKALQDIVGTLYKDGEREDSKTELIIAIINNIYSMCKNLPSIEFLDEYRAHCITIGKDVSYEINGQIRCAKAIGVLDDGTLEVNENGCIYSLNAGEVSLKK